MTKYFSKEHDLLKLCDRLKGNKIHYCPDCIPDKALFEKIKEVSGFRALKHHCVFRWDADKHCYKCNEFYRTKEDLFLAIADVKASAISRKLNIGYRKGHKKQSIWNAYHVWINKEINECVGKPPDDATILQDIVNSKDISTVFANKEEQIKQRSEDAWQCPFASLMTHSELTERWFHFLNKNSDYFKIPDRIDSIAEARKNSSIIQGNYSRQDYKEGLPICLIRLKLFANQSLSRIADTEIIKKINEIIVHIPNYFAGVQELYSLYDETIFVIPEPKEDVKDYIEKKLQSIDIFTTNYYIEGNFSRTRLFKRDFLKGYENIFKEFEYTFYPKLDDKIAPDLKELGEENIEAYHAKLCELCNMAEAKRTFWKFNDEEQKIHECLCKNCYDIRDRQKKINEAIQEDKEVPRSIGSDIAKWEKEMPDSRLCFIKINLNLYLLNELFKKILLEEFPLEKYKDKFNDENIGFSIIYEFLNKFKEFLNSVKGKITQGKFTKIDEKTGVSDEFEILDNFICLRFDEISEMKDVLKEFVNTYTTFFPQFKGFHDSKNISDDGKNKKAVFPITFSATISNIKFPFFEAWRYLNRQKENLINVLAVRNFELVTDYREYLNLNALNFEGKRISSFLYKLVEIDKRTESELLINTEILNSRDMQSEIFQGITKKKYDVNQLLNYYKLMGK